MQKNKPNSVSQPSVSFSTCETGRKTRLNAPRLEFVFSLILSPLNFSQKPIFVIIWASLRIQNFKICVLRHPQTKLLEIEGQFSTKSSDWEAFFECDLSNISALRGHTTDLPNCKCPSQSCVKEIIFLRSGIDIIT